MLLDPQLSSIFIAKYCLCQIAAKHRIMQKNLTMKTLIILTILNAWCLCTLIIKLTPTALVFPEGTRAAALSTHYDLVLQVFTHINSQVHTKIASPFTFLGQIAAPKSGKTVAPPASTSLIWGKIDRVETFPLKGHI